MNWGWLYGFEIDCSKGPKEITMIKIYILQHTKQSEAIKWITWPYRSIFIVLVRFLIRGNH